MKPKKRSEAMKYKAVYVGRRLFGISLGPQTLRQVFQLTHNQELLHFNRIKGVMIGYTYECGLQTMPRRPKRVDDLCMHNPEWEAADALVDVYRRKTRAEAKLKKLTKPALKAAVDAIVPLLKGLAHYEYGALIRYLTESAFDQILKGKKHVRS